MKIVCMSLILITAYILLLILDSYANHHHHLIMRELIGIGRVCVPIGGLRIFLWIGYNATMNIWQWVIMGVLMLINVGWLWLEGQRTITLLINNGSTNK